jgi:hypothetical protein
LSANRKLAYTGLSLGKKSRLRGRILRVAEIAQADANQAKPLISLSGLGNRQCESANSANTPLHFRPSFARNIQGRFFG